MKGMVFLSILYHLQNILLNYNGSLLERLAARGVLKEIENNVIWLLLAAWKENRIKADVGWWFFSWPGSEKDFEA